MEESKEQILLDQIADDFLARRRQGEMPSVAEYQQKFPMLPGSEIEELIFALDTVAEIKNENSDTIEGMLDETKTDLPAPTEIGPYKIVGALGEGGMGTVYRARQTEPIKREVALKVIRTGTGSEKILERFDAERQAVALMDHPNIAKVLDAGTAESGSPYFVMELVNGQPITKYCDEQKLGIKQRLELFTDVCNAVQHAHQKGIIHRDLKPGNILVGNYNGHPTAKVIDFGLAKALDNTNLLNDKSRLTQFGNIVGTLRYMSPEQAGLESLDVDTRTDIYSLGVVLYELLTGTTPVASEAENSQPVLKVLDMVLNEEPQRPSDRLSSSSETVSAITEDRKTNSSKLQGMLRGELDWVVMKAIEKDRDRRYETASEFALDVQRFVSGDVVLARPPSTSYKVRKFVRKNRGLVASTSAVAGLLIAGIAGTSYGLIKANQSAEQERLAKLDAISEKKIAEDKTVEAKSALDKADKFGKRASESLKLFTSAFASASPLQNAEAGVDMPAKDILINALANLEESGLDDEGQEEFLKSLANSFADLGEYDLALDASSKRLDKLEQIYDSREPQFPVGIASKEFVAEVDLILDAKRMIAECYGLKGDHVLCEKIYKENFDFTVEQCPTDDQRRIDATGYLANAYIKMEDWETALPLLETAIVENEKRHGDGFKGEAILKNNLAQCLSAVGEFEPAIEMFEEALEILQTNDAAASLNTKSALAGCYFEKGEHERGAELLLDVIEELKTRYGHDHPETLNAMNTLGACYWKLGQMEQSIPLYKEVVAESEKKLGRDHPGTQLAVANLAVNLLFGGRVEESVLLFDEGYAETDPAFSEYILFAYYLAGETEKFDERVDEKYSDPLKLARSFSNMARNFSKRNKFALAMKLCKKEIAIRDELPESWYKHLAYSYQGELYACLGDFEKADELLSQSIKELEERFDELPDPHQHWVIALPAHSLLEALVSDGTDSDRIEKWTTETQRLDALYKPSGN